MNKEIITVIRIEVICDNSSALSMLISKDGKLNRQGTGNLPTLKVAVMGVPQENIFYQLMKSVDNSLLNQDGIYTISDQSGLPLTYSIAFIGEKPFIKVFEFRLGSETKKNLSDLFIFFDKFIQEAIQLSDEWYYNSLIKK